MPIGFDSLTNLFTVGVSNKSIPGQTMPYGNYGNKRDKLGRPLIIRPGRSAINVFGGDSMYLNLIPMNKFLFFVKFYRPNNTSFQPNMNTQGTLFDWSKGVGLTVKKLDRPSIILQTETVNQYNKIRKIPLKREYGDITITFNDTHDMRVRSMMSEYYSYYFDDGLKTNYMDWSYDQTYNEFFGGGGFRINRGKSPDLTPFFSHIEVYQFSHGAYNVMTLVNPYITSYDPDNLSYEEGNVTQEISMKLSFEGLLFNSARLVLDGDLADESLLNKADFYEPENGRPVGDKLPTGWIPVKKPKEPDILGDLLKRLEDAIYKGDKDVIRVLTDSVLDSLGGFDFNGINIGGVLDSARYGGLKGAVENILISTGIEGAKEVILNQGINGNNPGSSAGGVNTIIQGTGNTLKSILGYDPNLQGGSGNTKNNSSSKNSNPIQNALGFITSKSNASKSKRFGG